MDENLFATLRSAYKTKDPFQISEKLKPLVYLLKKTTFLDSRLRFHPLGFLYAKLHEFDNLESIRIHIWKKDLESLRSPVNIHNHYYSVNSYVLCGSVIHKTYGEVEGLEHTHSIYEGSYGKNDLRILTKTDSSKALRVLNSRVVSKDELYTISKEEIHFGDSTKNDLTVTFVYTEEPGNPTPLVFGPINGQKQYSFKSKVLDIKNIEKIRALLP